MRPRVFAGLAVSALAVAGGALGQEPAAKPVESARASTPGGIPVGPLTVYPGIDLAHGYDDNLFLRPDNRVSSSYTLVSPHVRVEAKAGANTFELALRIDDGRYHTRPADSYTNYSLIGRGDLVFSGRAGLTLNAVYRHGRDARGTTDRSVSATPDEYDNTGIDGLFRYGAPGARGRIEIDAGAYALRYTNNAATTAAADRNTFQLGGTFFWRVRPRIELLFQAQHRNYDYLLGDSTLDSTENRFLVGAKWEQTAATSGTAKFGRLTKNFDSPLRQSSTSSSWDMGTRWSPLTYSVFDFVTSRQTGETTGIGDTIVGTNHGVTWSHAWSSRVRTQALASLRKDAFTGAGVVRQDDTTSLGLKVGYDFRRWLRFGAEYTYSTRDSNIDGFQYRRNLMLFTVGGTL